VKAWLGTCGAVAVVVASNIGSADVLAIDNGVVGAGHVEVQTDDYGSFGTWMGPQHDDQYSPVGAQGFYATYIAGAYLFVTDAAGTSVALLTDDRAWIKLEEGTMQDDGIAGPHGLTRTITTLNTQDAVDQVHSAFVIAGGGVMLRFDVRQQLTYDAATNTSTLAQTYTITNAGAGAVDLVFHVMWDPDLVWGTNYTDDVGGVGNGLCYLYAREPNAGALDRSVALADGGSQVTPSFYYVGKAGQAPLPAAMPVYEEPGTGAALVFDSFGSATPGMPVAWRDNLAGVGSGVAGETPTVLGDVLFGSEYRFALAAAASTEIRVHRIYGTSTMPCAAGPNCGNSTVDGAEACDTGGVDTATCNGATCTVATCGDGYVNTVAGESCESGGVDTQLCNGTTCTVAACGDGYTNAAAGEACDDGEDTPTCNLANCQPAACGDGIVNVAASEDCEAGSLCDLPTCSYNFSVGGGCAGCGADGGDGAGWLVVVACALFLRRKRSQRSLISM
jgi:hypothetical protein